jgi:hypothetical protein
MSGDPAYVRDLKAFTRGDLTLGDLPALESELYGANDRASAVLFGSIAESALTVLLKATLRPNLNSGATKALFGPEGPLGTFSSKTALAFAMGPLGPISRGDLDLIRLLRNEFAHSKKHFGFEQPQVAAVCKHLKTPELPGFFIPHGYLLAVPGKESIDKLVPKTRYVASCHTLSQKMLELSESMPTVFKAFEKTIGGLP